MLKPCITLVEYWSEKFRKPMTGVYICSEGNLSYIKNSAECVWVLTMSIAEVKRFN